MGQVNASLGGPEGRSGGDQLQWPSMDGTNIGPNSMQDESVVSEKKKRDLKTMHCVKSRIDMLIEDCLNIKPVPSERKTEVNDKSKDLELKTENGKIPCVQNTKDEVKKCELPEKVVGVIQKSEDISSSVEQAKPVEGSGEQSNKDTGSVTDNSSSNSTTSQRESGSSLEMTGDQENVTRKKTITTFQKFIDEVFDHSLHAMKKENSASASNFLKLCSDSLKTDKELHNETTGSIESDKQAKEETKPNVESPEIVKIEEKQKRDNNEDKEITLKDHIERFLEASFKEENNETSTNSAATPKNLNIHMLVNDMITRGLKITNTDPTSTRNVHVNVQAKIEPPKEALQVSTSKRNGTQFSDVKHKTLVGPSERNIMEHGTPLTEKRHDPKNLHNTQSYTNPPYSKAHIQGAPNVYSRDNLKHVDNEPGLLNAPGKHDPFDPRFADPKFQDNRIDIVPHEVNAQNKRESQLDRRVIPKTDPPVVPMPVTRQGLYQPRSPYPAGPASPYTMNSRGSPSVQPSNDRYGPMGRPSVHPGHHPDCKCPACLSNSQQSHLRDQHMEYQRHQRSPNYAVQRFSPSDRSRVSPMASANMYHSEQPAVMVRPPHSSTLPVGQSPYPQLSPNMMPHRSPGPIERTVRSSTSTVDHGGNFNIHARQTTNLGEYHQGQYIPGRRGDNYTPPVSSIKYSRPAPEELISHIKVVDRSSNSSRLSNIPPREHLSNCHPPPVKVYTDQDMSKPSKHTDSAETESAPLDLTVKRAYQQPDFQRQSFVSGNQQTFQTSQTKLSPTLTFIKHLENSVDKYCQELISPPSPTFVSRHMKPQVVNRSVSPNDRRSPMVGYAPNPHGISTQGLYPPMLQSRSLPSPHFSGGITMGQPLVDKTQSSQQQSLADIYGMNNTQSLVNVQQMPQPQQGMVQTQSGYMPPVHAQGNFEPAGKRNMNNVSKHEPIQNIIGNHDSSDILYLYCKVCASTYGSLYGFRKHFRNQHGFEPRPEHTIVHTISGTKSALHIPSSAPIEAVRPGEKSMGPRSMAGNQDKSVNNFDDHVVYNVDESPRASDSPHDPQLSVLRGQNKLDGPIKQKTSDPLEKATGLGETKYLECPECGKTFQLNDFGSYKRHCRQHGHIKPFGCTDCQRSFMDQKGLKEHYKLHMKESQFIDGNRSDSSNSVDVTNYSCCKCDKSFFSSAQLDIHMDTIHQRSSQNSADSERNLSETNKTITGRPKFAQTKESSVSVGKRPEMTQMITSAPSIVKQAAESMTAQVCPDSSWDKPEVDKKLPITHEISSDNNCDSGYSSSVGSNISQLHDDASHKKSADIESLSGKPDTNKNETNEENYEVYYKHKKFFHPRKRESSFSCNTNDPTPSKVAKVSEVSEATASSCGNTPVTSSTVNTNAVSCDSQFVDNKGPDGSKAEQSNTDVGKPNISDKSVMESEDCTSKTTEARHNLPFVWDRTTRSRKTK